MAVEFDRNDRVIKTFGNTSAFAPIAVSSSKDFVLLKLGEPAIRLPPRNCVMFFTTQKQKVAGVVRLRHIVFDDKGAVAQIVSLYSWEF